MADTASSDAASSNAVSSNSFPSWLLDPLRPTEAEEVFRFRGGQRAWLIPTALGAALLVASLAGAAAGALERFYFAYLVGWFFCLTLSLGALFFLLIHHLTKAHWGLVVRRIPEALIWAFPVLALLVIPILIGMHDLFKWTHPELFVPTSPDYDEIIAGKEAYLNVPFFLVRVVLYFVIWSYMAHRLYTLSVRQDAEAEPFSPPKLRKVSAWGLPVFAVTLAFASYDFLMSLDAHWFSTIFGVYIFAGSFFAATAFIVLAAILLQRQGGMLRQVVNKEHYHDLGKWMFGMTAFWAYIAFSQYMLIWYGGIPEETVFFRHRLEHGWEWHSYALILFHFILPFLILLPRAPKRMIPVVSIMAVWFLFIHWFDLHWLAMPVQAEHGGFHWIDFSTWLGLFGLYIGMFVYRLGRHSLVPQRDPYLAKSLRFVNI